MYHKPSYDGFYCACYSERAKTDPVNTNAQFNDKIEAVQYNAALAISGCVCGTSREKIYSKLGLTSLYDRRRFHRLSLYYKILNNLTPEYLRILIPDSIRRSYAMRNDRGNVLPARTQKYRYSFFPDTSKAWNLLSSFIKCSPSLSIFKKRYSDFFIVKPNTIYEIHNPIGLRYLTRLHVGLSHLRSHKYRHNFKDTETDICPCSQNTPENVEHVSFICMKGGGGCPLAPCYHYVAVAQWLNVSNMFRQLC